MSELVIERRLAAPRKLVFQFVTQTEHLLKWWGPEGMHVPEHGLDLSRKGRWWSIMANDEGGRYKVSGDVVRIDPPEAVEFTWAWHDENDERGHESHVRLEVHEAEGGGSLLRLFHTGLENDESATNHRGGWDSSLNKLERLAA